MKNFIFNENIFNKVLTYSKINKYEEKDFLIWLNKVTKLMSRNKIINLKFKNGKLEQFSGVEIKKEEDLNFIFYLSNSKFLDALIKVLNNFEFNYWKQKLLFLINQKDIEDLSYSNILVHASNNDNFVIEENENFKILIENLIHKIKEDKINYYSDVFQVLILLIKFKEVFGNNWLVKSIDELMVKSKKKETKQFSFILDKMSHMFNNLDFSSIQISKHFKKILKGNMAIIKNNELKPIYCEINLYKFYQEEKLVEQIVINNITTGFNLIVENFQRDPDVFEIRLKNPNKTSIALIALSDTQKTIEKIDSLINEILKMCKENEVLIREKFEKQILFLMLNDDLKTNSGSGRKTKI